MHQQPQPQPKPKPFDDADPDQCARSIAARSVAPRFARRQLSGRYLPSQRVFDDVRWRDHHPALFRRRLPQAFPTSSWTWWCNTAVFRRGLVTGSAPLHA